MYDVAVVGAGPIGSYVAHSLERSGYSVAVFDTPERPVEHCSGVVGSWFADKFPEFPRVDVHDICIEFAGGKKCASIDNPVHVIKRADFDDYLRSKLDTDIIYERVLRINSDGVQTRGSTYRARRIIGADGAVSVVRKALGEAMDFIFTYQRIASAASSEKRITMMLNNLKYRGFFGWRIETGTELKEGFGSKVRHEPAPDQIRWLIPSRPVSKVTNGRVFLVGDAAGHVKPTTGGGLYYGFLAADALIKNIESPAGYARFHRRLSAKLKVLRFAADMFFSMPDDRVSRIMATVTEDRWIRIQNHFDEHILLIIALLGRHPSIVKEVILEALS